MPHYRFIKRSARPSLHGKIFGWLKVLTLITGLWLLGLVTAFGIVGLMSGCALNRPLANLSSPSLAPKVTLDGKAIDKIEAFTGTVKAQLATRTVKGHPVKTLALKSTGFWEFLGGYGIWFFAGGLAIALGILGAVLALFNVPTIGWRASGIMMVGGGLLLAATAFLKLFWGWLLGLSILGLIAFAVEWVLHHQGTLKKAVAAASVS